MTGSIFHDSHLPLPKWILATYLITESKKGMSANQMKRILGVSYKTAWYLCHRIRDAMAQAQVDAKPLSGIVEADETFVGGKAHGMGRAYKGNKAIVVGVVQRKGEIRLQVAQDRSRKVLQEIVVKNTAPETEAIYTDEWVGYSGLGDEDTRHETVNHSFKEYVRGDVHTNSVENVWSLLKRSIVGSYHHVSVKHLPAYVEELEWRFSQRDNPFLFRDTLEKLLTSESLPYRELTASS
jgi:transposase-like protein